MTPKLDAALDELQRTAPAGVVVERRVFRQADFIQAAIDNVVEAIRDGTFWVFVVLLLFLASVRTSFITLTAIPLSVLVTALVFSYFPIPLRRAGIENDDAQFSALAEIPLGEIRSPALIIHGDDDSNVPFAQAEQAAQAIPGARMLVIPSGTHATTLFDPRTRQEIRGFLAGLAWG